MEKGDKLAYPNQEIVKNYKLPDEKQTHLGLTKREIYAMSAMQGILSGNDYKSDLKEHQILIVKSSIDIAGELLKQLEK